MLNVQRQIFQDKNKFINIISIQKMRDELHKTGNNFGLPWEKYVELVRTIKISHPKQLQCTYSLKSAKVVRKMKGVWHSPNSKYGTHDGPWSAFMIS